jgi:hypothetical protein
MKRMNRQAFSIYASTAALIGIAFSAPADNQAGRSRIYVTAAASSLVDQGLASAAPDSTESFQGVPAPGIRFVANQAQATTSPWVDSNAWRFQRGVQKANYDKLPAGAAPLAAAEAFAYRVDAILNPDLEDLPELGKILAFLEAQDQPALPIMANIGVIDDKSSLMGEVLNMLTRRNLLYRVVSAPDPKLGVTVQIGSPDFPKESATNPSDFAARVRAKVGDDRRLVRLYGTSTAIAHLTGDEKRVRLVLLSYSRNRAQPGVRVRLLGRYRPAKFTAYGAVPDAKLADIEHPENTTEFSIPDFNTIAIVDLDAVK